VSRRAESCTSGWRIRGRPFRLLACGGAGGRPRERGQTPPRSAAGTGHPQRSGVARGYSRVFPRPRSPPAHTPPRTRQSPSRNTAARHHPSSANYCSSPPLGSPTPRRPRHATTAGAPAGGWPSTHGCPAPGAWRLPNARRDAADGPRGGRANARLWRACGHHRRDARARVHHAAASSLACACWATSSGTRCRQTKPEQFRTIPNDTELFRFRSSVRLASERGHSTILVQKSGNPPTAIRQRGACPGLSESLKAQPARLEADCHDSPRT